MTAQPRSRSGGTTANATPRSSENTLLLTLILIGRHSAAQSDPSDSVVVKSVAILGLFLGDQSVEEPRQFYVGDELSLHGNGLAVHGCLHRAVDDIEDLLFVFRFHGSLILNTAKMIGADFVAVDMTHANHLTISIMAMVADEERSTISAHEGHFRRSPQRPQSRGRVDAWSATQLARVLERGKAAA